MGVKSVIFRELYEEKTRVKRKEGRCIVDVKAEKSHHVCHEVGLEILVRPERTFLILGFWN